MFLLVMRDALVTQATSRISRATASERAVVMGKSKRFY